MVDRQLKLITIIIINFSVNVSLSNDHHTAVTANLITGWQFLPCQERSWKCGIPMSLGTFDAKENNFYIHHEITDPNDLEL